MPGQLILAAIFAVTALTLGVENSSHWTASWASAQQTPEPQNALAPDILQDATLRQMVHLSLGGERIRVHISNAFGTAPLRVASAQVAKAVSPSAPSIEPATSHALLFSGKPDALIPAGAEYLSDPIAFPVTAGTDLAISIYFEQPPDRETSHPGSRATSYVAHGNLVAAADLPDARRVDHWYQLSGVDVASGRKSAAIVALGDSITDGHGATTNGNDRWTDVLSRRLQAGPNSRGVSVLNLGIGGNHLLTDGLGPNALARFDRDVLAQASARWVIVLEGVNDLGGLEREHEVTPEQHHDLVNHLIAAYVQIVARSHAGGLRVIGCTITPYTGSNYYHPGPASEADRLAVNDWIRARGHFDAVVDFDAIIRDPSQPGRLLPKYDSGDHLHPSVAGYAAMADAVPLTLFR